MKPQLQLTRDNSFQTAPSPHAGVPAADVTTAGPSHATAGPATLDKQTALQRLKERRQEQLAATRTAPARLMQPATDEPARASPRSRSFSTSTLAASPISMHEIDSLKMAGSLSETSVPAPMFQLMEHLQSGCAQQIGRLLNAYSALASFEPRGEIGERSLLMMAERSKLSGLARRIETFQKQIKKAADKGELRLPATIMHSGGEIIQFDSMDLHQAQRMCDGYKLQVDDCLFELEQSKEIFKSHASGAQPFKK